MKLIKPFFNRLGGKGRLVKYILPHLPAKTNIYVEPFCGAAWVYFNYNGAYLYVLNDLDKMVFRMLRAIQKHTVKEFKSRFDLRKSRELFYELKARFKNKKYMDQIDDLELLYIYRYLNYYGVLGDYETFNESVRKKDSLPLENFIVNHRIMNEKKTLLFNEDYTAILEKFDDPETFFYLDPPRPFNPNSDRYQGLTIDYITFVKRIRHLKGKFLLTIDKRTITYLHNHLFYENELEDFIKIEVKVKYSSDNLQKYKSIKKVRARTEYLIMNYESGIDKAISIDEIEEAQPNIQLTSQKELSLF